MNRVANSLYSMATLAVLFLAPFAALAKPQVEVTNFPDPQNVTGAVDVLNLPAVQDVEVLNLPAVQDVNVLSAPAAACSSFQFVGFSSGLLMGSGPIGVFSATDLCKVDFDTRARFCSSEEVLNTVSPPAVAGGPAWVRPVFMPYGTSRSTDASGATAGTPRDLSCGGWRGAAPGIPPIRGLTATSSGVFNSEVCSVARPVACCSDQ